MPNISETYVSESACHELDKAAYALALLRWPGRNAVLVGIILLVIVPLEAIPLPLFDLLNDLCNTCYVQFLPFVANELSSYLLQLLRDVERRRSGCHDQTPGPLDLNAIYELGRRLALIPRHAGFLCPLRGAFCPRCHGSQATTASAGATAARNRTHSTKDQQRYPHRELDKLRAKGSPRRHQRRLGAHHCAGLHHLPDPQHIPLRVEDVL
jgi:hypothetical protein